MAPIRRSSCSPNNIRFSNLVPLPLNNPNNPRTSITASHHISMMTRYCTRRHLSRSPHAARTKRPAIWHNSFHYIRSFLLPRIFLSILPLQPRSHARTWRLLTPHWNYNSRPLRSTTPQHRRSPSIRRNCHVSPPQPNRGGTQTSHSIPGPHNPARFILHCPSSHRIL